MERRVHVVPTASGPGRWAVRLSESTRAWRVFREKADAVLFAEQWAAKLRKVLFVHRNDGTVESTFNPNNL